VLQGCLRFREFDDNICAFKYIFKVTCDGDPNFSDTRNDPRITSDLWMRRVLDSPNELHIGVLGNASRDASPHATANTSDNYTYHLFNVPCG
jgi:hypothetical protein